MDFLISVSGIVDLTCDISNEKFQFPINNEIKFLVKFGEEYDDSNEEIITIPHHYSEFNNRSVLSMKQWFLLFL